MRGGIGRGFLPRTGKQEGLGGEEWGSLREFAYGRWVRSSVSEWLSVLAAWVRADWVGVCLEAGIPLRDVLICLSLCDLGA